MSDPGEGPRPGYDEIIVTTPADHTVCYSREHTRLGVLAKVVVTFGEMGTADRHRGALWIEAWGQSYAMCGECWDATRQVAKAARPGLVITEAPAAS